MSKAVNLKPSDIISEDCAKLIHGRSDFGYMTPRDVINDGVVKVHLGYHCGSTQQAILIEHGLAWRRFWESPKRLKPKGKLYLKALIYSKGVSGLASDFLNTPVRNPLNQGGDSDEH